jgi:hypothetical protein
MQASAQHATHTFKRSPPAPAPQNQLRPGERGAPDADPSWSVLQFPENLTPGNMLWFLAAPTLVYQVRLGAVCLSACLFVCLAVTLCMSVCRSVWWSLLSVRRICWFWRQTGGIDLAPLLTNHTSHMSTRPPLPRPQVNFPRTQRIRKRWLFRRMTELAIFLGLFLFIIQQYVTPTVEVSWRCMLHRSAV